MRVGVGVRTHATRGGFSRERSPRRERRSSRSSSREFGSRRGNETKRPGTRAVRAGDKRGRRGGARGRRARGRTVRVEPRDALGDDAGGAPAARRARLAQGRAERRHMGTAVFPRVPPAARRGTTTTVVGAPIVPFAVVSARAASSGRGRARRARAGPGDGSRAPRPTRDARCARGAPGPARAKVPPRRENDP